MPKETFDRSKPHVNIGTIGKKENIHTEFVKEIFGRSAEIALELFGLQKAAEEKDLKGMVSVEELKKGPGRLVAKEGNITSLPEGPGRVVYSDSMRISHPDFNSGNWTDIETGKVVEIKEKEYQDLSDEEKAETLQAALEETSRRLREALGCTQEEMINAFTRIANVCPTAEEAEESIKGIFRKLIEADEKIILAGPEIEKQLLKKADEMFISDHWPDHFPKEKNSFIRNKMKKNKSKWQK